jgi:signal peptidase I
MGSGLLKPTKKKILITIAIFIVVQLTTHLVPIYLVVQSNSMSPTFNTGDIILVSGIAFENLKTGDIVLFTDNYGGTVAHRVVSIDTTGRTFTTKGDANSQTAAFERDVPSNNLRGIVTGTIPALGWLDLFYMSWLIKLAIIYFIVSLIIRGPKPNSGSSREPTPNTHYQAPLNQ